MAPVIALFAGALIGLAVAFATAITALAWPVIRAIWWWLPEIALFFGLVASWVWLADHLTFPHLLGVVTVIVAVPAVVVPARRLVVPARRLVVSLAWCLILRHRIRTCFAEFIVYNRTGSLPLVLWCIPTPVGARISVHLRPGLSLDSIQTQNSGAVDTSFRTTEVVYRRELRPVCLIGAEVMGKIFASLSSRA